jgi:hypothetical protein
MAMSMSMSMSMRDERHGRLGDAALVLRWVRTNGLEWFTLRECQQRLRGRFRRAAQLEPVISQLVDLGHLERVTPPPKVGRPPRLFRVVNPGSEA